MAIRYTQNVAIMQAPFSLSSGPGDFIGGGPIAGPQFGAFPVQYNDSGLELGQVEEVTAIYQLYGNESVSDIINIYLAQPGSMLDPAYSSVCTTAGSATLTITVGDDDVTGWSQVNDDASAIRAGITGPRTPNACKRAPKVK